MLPQLDGLLVLQDRDLRIHTLGETLARLPAEEARAKDKLASDLAAVEKAKAALQENEMAIKKVEIDVETRKTTIARLKKQQFETRKNDEYQALANEIVRYTGDVDSLETEELELMEAADQLRASRADAEAGLAQTQRIVDEDLAAIAARQETLGKELVDLKAEREKLAAAVDPSLLTLYDRLAMTKKGAIVTSVENGQCRGCHVKLIPATLIKVQAESEIAQCENCARILYAID